VTKGYSECVYLLSENYVSEQPQPMNCT